MSYVLLRRDARHGVGEYVSDRAVPVVRRDCADRDRPGHRRVRTPRWIACWRSPATAAAAHARAVSPLYFFSYTFIPLSTIAFPHITIFCLTARRAWRSSREPSSCIRSVSWRSGCRASFSASRRTVHDVPGSSRSSRSALPGPAGRGRRRAALAGGGRRCRA